MLATGLAFGANDSSDLLQSAGDMLDKVPLTTGQFTQTSAVAALTAPLVSSGSFYFDRDRGVIWHVERPIAAQFVFRPTSDGAQPAAPNQMQIGWVGQLLNAVLAGDLSALGRMFVVDGSHGIDTWALTLVPKSAAVGRALAKIDIDGGTSIHRIKLTEANGDDITIVFSAVQHPDSLPADVVRELEQAR
jgi:hypothetical protein